MRHHALFNSVSFALLVVGTMADSIRAATHPRPASDQEKIGYLRKESKAQKKLRKELERLKWPIVFCSNAHGAANIYRINANGGGMKRLTDEEHGSWANGGWGPQVSPDGTQILWMSTVRKVPSGALEKITFDQKTPLKRRRLSKTTVWRLNADGSNARFISLGADPSWAPDGKRISYSVATPMASRNPVAVFDLALRKETIVTPRNWSLYRSGGMPRYTADGKWIISGGGGRILGIPLDTTGLSMPANRHPVILIRGRGDEGCNQEVSPSGKWLAWVVDTHDDHGSWLGFAELDFKRARQPRPMKLGWSSKSVNYDPCFSPNGKYLAYMHGPIRYDQKSYNSSWSEIYATRFPPDGVYVRLTFLNAASRHPHWVKRLDGVNRKKNK